MKTKELMEKKEKEEENLKKIVDFLKEHNEEAFTAEEISEKLNLKCAERLIYYDDYKSEGGKNILKNNNIKRKEIIVSIETKCIRKEYLYYETPPKRNGGKSGNRR